MEEAEDATDEGARRTKKEAKRRQKGGKKEAKRRPRMRARRRLRRWAWRGRKIMSSSLAEQRTTHDDACVVPRHQRWHDEM